MESLKNTVYDLILNGSSGQYDLRMIASVLKLDSTADFVMLNKVLNQLEDEYLIVRNKKDKYLLAHQARVYRGKISVNTKGKGFFDLENETIIIPKENLNGALDNDEVVVKLVNKKNDDLGYVEKIIKRNTVKVIGTLTISKKVVVVTLDEERLNNYKIKVVNADKFKLVNGLKALFKIVKYPYVNKNRKSLIMEVAIEQIIGHKDDPGVDILSILLSYEIDPIFPEEVMNQVKEIPQEVSESCKKGRKDLTHLDIVTIDGDDAKDFDDAISIEKTIHGYKLGVHIADVSYYVRKNTPLDIEARKRGTSTYVVDKVVPMLPHLLSNGICSLNPDVERLTLSCVMNVNHKGEIVDYDLFESVIKSKYRMTYNNVNKIFDGNKSVNKKYKDISHLFYLMRDCAKLIRKRRDLNGSIDFDKEEALIVVDDKGKVVDIKKRERRESENIIEDFMISAN
ncbi:MAG TPA: ribonuclease R, partial [Erysipelotrichaceae bacterium]|nr:ribonuclease R [Erysipelotrichaceae bacterium]